MINRGTPLFQQNHFFGFDKMIRLHPDEINSRGKRRSIRIGSVKYKLIITGLKIP